MILKRFEQPDEVRKFAKGKIELVHIGGMTIGRVSYEPGGKWSVHLGKASGQKSCAVEHVGMVVSGRATAATDDGRIMGIKAGAVFYIAPASIAGWSATSRTFLCTFSAQKNTPRRNEQRYKLRA